MADRASRVVVVSLRKSGTHLIREVLSAFGYAITGAVARVDAEGIVRDRDAVLVALSAAYPADELHELMNCEDPGRIAACIRTALMAVYDVWGVRLGSFEDGPEYGEDKPETGANAPGWPTARPMTAPQMLTRALSDPGLRSFGRTPANVAWFVHELDQDRLDHHFRDEWDATGEPKIILNYRDPRDVMVSMVDFLGRGDATELGTFRHHHEYAAKLADLPPGSARLDVALDDPHFPGSDAFERAQWLVDDPRVCKVSFEELIGPRGGGSVDAQARAVDRLGRHLGVDEGAAAVAPKIFNENAHTFHVGQIGRWEGRFTPQQHRRFLDRHGSILEAYGYSEVTAAY